MSLHVLIIGAGLAGLGAALSIKIANPDHEVTVLEAVPALAEIGAGLQLTPNSTRLFKTWGIYDRLQPKSAAPVTLSVRRYDGTKILAREEDFQKKILSRYDAPYWNMHRVDLQQAMAGRCEELGVKFRFSSRVAKVDFDEVKIEVHGSGEKISGDVIICTDGLWSSTRSQFIGRQSPAILTGDLAFRIVINTDELHGPDAEELRAFVEETTVNFWVGPESHVVSYTLRAGKMLNIVLLCPDDLPEGVSKQEGNVEEMRALFENWDPILKKFLAQVKTVAKWKLMWLNTLPNWTDVTGTFWMAGDCCHPMLPYLAQGANSSLEDGAVIGSLLAHVSQENKEVQLQKAARMYEQLRKDRGEKITKETFKQRHDFHLPDGEEQRARDELMLSMLGKELKPDFPSRWTCPRVQPWLYGYDAYKEAEEAYKANPF
ncbi:hypothetical protein F5884DRAFT_860304 [Xylogone sp. PMI_703]|nr:hypothetical protein F5884DRAFT_860304 [Xylogone sp. PMI_703]